MRLRMQAALFILSCVFITGSLPAEEPLLLLGTIVKWQYPQSELQMSQMSDGATVNVEGNRTVYSNLLKTTMLTDEPVAKVVDFYKELFSAKRDRKDHPLAYAGNDGVSVAFGDESEGGLLMHTILVNSKSRSTTIVITRATGDKKTRIIWKQYVRDENPQAGVVP